MKKRLFLKMMLTMIVAALVFSSCSNNDEDDFDSSNLIGTWEVIDGEGWGEYMYDNPYEEGGGGLIQFKPDHTYIQVIYEDEEDDLEISKGEWILSYNTLTIKEKEGDMPGFNWTYTILKLEKNRMELSILGCIGYLKKVSDSKIKRYL